MILCDRDLHVLCQEGLIRDYDPAFLNPASVDVRVGSTIERERTGFLRETLPERGLPFFPGDFARVAVLECVTVPNGYGVEMCLKSTRAREGWDHGLAGWADPGWNGILTMEVRNVLTAGVLLLVPGARFAQLKVHRLSGRSARPYNGRYNNATGVEGPKP